MIHVCPYSENNSKPFLIPSNYVDYLSCALTPILHYTSSSHLNIRVGTLHLLQYFILINKTNIYTLKLYHSPCPICETIEKEITLSADDFFFFTIYLCCKCIIVVSTSLSFSIANLNCYPIDFHQYKNY